MNAFDADGLMYAAVDDHPLGRRVRALFATEPGSRTGWAQCCCRRFSPSRCGTEMRRSSTPSPVCSADWNCGCSTRSPPEVATSLAATHRLRAADAAHLATVLVAGADRFVTNNRRDFTHTSPTSTSPTRTY